MKASCICKYLKLYFDNCNDEIGYVHSIYENSLNIITDSGSFITLLNNDNAIQPMSMSLYDGFDIASQADIQDKLILSKEGLCFYKSHLFINITNSILWDSDIIIDNKFKSRSEIYDGLDKLKYLLLKEDVNFGLYPLIHKISFDQKVGVNSLYPSNLNHYCDFIQGRLVDLLNSLSDSDFDRAETILSKFIGFGVGLTPSSDDVLCGILAVISYACFKINNKKWCMDAKRFAKKVYQASISKTTIVSEQMLKHAKDGRFSRTYHMFIKSLMLKDTLDIEDMALDVMKHGATSGKDFLLGVYCMEMLILNYIIC